MGERSKIALALCALTLAVYAEVGTHAFVDFDDTKHIAQNPDVAPGWSAERMVRVFTHPHFGDFIPLTYLSLQLDRSREQDIVFEVNMLVKVRLERSHRVVECAVADASVRRRRESVRNSIQLT